MSSLIPGNNKHLSLKDREYIEQALNNRKSFREIARYLCKDPSTISKEVWKRRIVNSWNRGSFNNPYNFCIHRYHCKKTNACGKLVICDRYVHSSLAYQGFARGLGEQYVADINAFALKNCPPDIQGKKIGEWIRQERIKIFSKA